MAPASLVPAAGTFLAEARVPLVAAGAPVVFDDVRDGARAGARTSVSSLSSSFTVSTTATFPLAVLRARVSASEGASESRAGVVRVERRTGCVAGAWGCEGVV